MKKIVIGFVLSAIMVGCVQDINDLTFEVIKPGISIPIGSFSIQANSLTKLGDSLQVREGESNVIEFFYNTELLRSPLNDRFTIADQSFSDAIPFNAFVFVAGATNEVKASEYNSFTISNVDLPTPTPGMKKLVFKGGVISVSQSKDFDHNVETVIKFPKLTKNGVPLSITLSNTMSVNEPLSLYEFDLTGPLGTGLNTVEYEISTTISNTGTSTTGTLSLGFEMSSMLFSYVEGDFQTYPFDLFEGNFDLGLPSSDIPDNILLTNPSVELVIDNSAGIEFGLDIVEVSATEADGTKSFITGTYDDQTIILQGSPSPGAVATSSYAISTQNTDNLVSLLSSIPSSIFFSGNASANPNGVPLQGNFITDSSEVVINANLTLPMEGYANNYALIDTLNDINVKLDDNGDISVDEVNLRLQIENNFPFEIRMQLYFLDSANQQLVLDSLFATVDEQRIFTSATVDGGTGLVTSSSIETVDINIQNEKYENIKNTGSIKLVVYVLTSGANDSPSKSVKITTDNFLKLDIGLSATALIDPEKLL